MSVVEKPKGEPFDNGPKDATGQFVRYAVLPDGERAAFVRPLRNAYIHTACGVTTYMGKALAETYAADPLYYGSTFCTHCRDHFPVEGFTWLDGAVVGS